ncbi:MAG: hypothetical protein CMLOHMNK_03337 [Steroidobacteraceae bacterium]|nr:hypothetical protein [Steroidobacteraceae bacterium]
MIANQVGRAPNFPLAIMGPAWSELARPAWLRPADSPRDRSGVGLVGRILNKPLNKALFSHCE